MYFASGSFGQLNDDVAIPRAVQAAVFADEMADRWMRLPNKGPLFENRTPIEAMIEGGIPTMLDVRRHVDALRAGF